LSDLDVEGTFRWYSDNSVTANPLWCTPAGEPDNLNGNQHCAAINADSNLCVANNNWFDFACSRKWKAAVCRIPGTAGPSTTPSAPTL
jgi:hypothetical protein